MTIHGRLLEMLVAVADALGDDLRDRVVFVGGCTTALFITDSVTLEGVRATDDIDLIIDLASRVEWPRLQSQLRQRGFSENPEDKVICRMRLGELKVDFMPDNEDILGFSNQWYAEGMRTAETRLLADRFEIRLLTPALFIATKIEAYRGRGSGDLLTSRDMEDILLVVDGREELATEVGEAAEAIRHFIAKGFRELQGHYDFENFLTGNILGPPGRVGIVRARIAAIAASDGEG